MSSSDRVLVDTPIFVLLPDRPLSQPKVPLRHTVDRYMGAEAAKGKKRTRLVEESEDLALPQRPQRPPGSLLSPNHPSTAHKDQRHSLESAWISATPLQRYPFHSLILDRSPNSK